MSTPTSPHSKDRALSRSVMLASAEGLTLSGYSSRCWIEFASSSRIQGWRGAKLGFDKSCLLLASLRPAQLARRSFQICRSRPFRHCPVSDSAGHTERTHTYYPRCARLPDHRSLPVEQSQGALRSPGIRIDILSSRSTKISWEDQMVQ